MRLDRLKNSTPPASFAWVWVLPLSHSFRRCEIACDGVINRFPNMTNRIATFDASEVRRDDTLRRFIFTPVLFHNFGSESFFLLAWNVPRALLFLLCAIHSLWHTGWALNVWWELQLYALIRHRWKIKGARARHLLFIQHQCFKHRCAAADHSSLSGSLREYLVQKSLSASGNKFAACLSLLSRSVGL